MSHPLRRLSKSALVGLADALAAGRLAPPFSRAALAGKVPEGEVDAVRAALLELVADGMAPRHVARALALLA
ncbi:MAG TPA: phospholipase, partial [Myxococcota bacterium]|nr:phospholipase [Myxococcota bacterium]